jgi:two-component sensor histidine kinase
MAMLQSIDHWLSVSSSLTPHGFCLLWEPWLIRAFVIGDAVTALAYFAIPAALAIFVRRRTDLAFRPVFLLFATFILLCGATHWLDLLTIWLPIYGIEAVVKLATAAVSCATAAAVWYMLPKALALPSHAQLRMMVDELNHRVKNTLATVQFVAGQTLREADVALRDTLDERLEALANAHNSLSRENWAGADLAEIVELSVAPWRGQGSRIQVSGPPLRLRPRAVLAITIALHELATNALKYGALSASTEGVVDLHWSCDEGMFCLVWSEFGGPAVARPTRRGFGTRVIERALAQDLGGTADIVFRREGILCSVKTDLANIMVNEGPLLNVGAAL